MLHAVSHKFITVSDLSYGVIFCCLGRIHKLKGLAGNQRDYSTSQVGSSEAVRSATPCTFCFDNFLISKPAHIGAYSIDFLIWLIGFTEGDGSFVCTTRGEVHFVIVQHSGDIQVLQHIKDNLGFGKIYKQGNRAHRYIVQDKKNLLHIINIFNGNLVFSKRRAQFEKFVECFNKHYNMDIKVLPSNVSPLLSDAWLSGLIDSEGCFNVSVVSRPEVRIRFIVSQIGEDIVLGSIMRLFNAGRLEFNRSNNCTSFVISSPNSLLQVVSYLSVYPLRSRKHTSYTRWVHVLGLMLTGKQLTNDGREEIQRLSRLINNFDSPSDV